MTVQERRDALLDDLPGLAFGMRYAATSDVTRRMVAERIDALIAAVTAEAESELLNTAVMLDVMTHAKRERALEAALREVCDAAHATDTVYVLGGDRDKWERFGNALTAARALLAGEDAG